MSLFFFLSEKMQNFPPPTHSLGDGNALALAQHAPSKAENRSQQEAMGGHLVLWVWDANPASVTYQALPSTNCLTVLVLIGKMAKSAEKFERLF